MSDTARRLCDAILNKAHRPKGPLCAEQVESGSRCSTESMSTITTPRINKPGTEYQGESEKTPLYRVVLLDDDDHTYDYVIEMLEEDLHFYGGAGAAARPGSGCDGPHRADYLRAAGSGIRTGSGAKLRARLEAAAVAGVDVGDCGTRRRNRIAAGLPGPPLGSPAIR